MQRNYHRIILLTYGKFKTWLEKKYLKGYFLNINYLNNILSVMVPKFWRHFSSQIVTKTIGIHMNQMEIINKTIGVLINNTEIFYIYGRKCWLSLVSLTWTLGEKNV